MMESILLQYPQIAWELVKALWDQPVVQSTALTLLWLFIGLKLAFWIVPKVFEFLSREHGRALSDHITIIEREPLALAHYRVGIFASVVIALAIYLSAIIR